MLPYKLNPLYRVSQKSLPLRIIFLLIEIDGLALGNVYFH